jgi:peptidoglycan/xylan/chitin deacetylase (PgdA/CDA1 family)
MEPSFFYRQPPAAKAAKPLASVSLDLDNQWSYMKIHGDEGWENFPSYFDIFIPHALDLLERLDLKITFFIVGRDAALEKNKHYLKQITARGHEVGNHSFNHDSWLQKYSLEELQKEICNTHDQIVQATGQEPVGFRGPGFSWSPELLEILRDKEYIFDASTLPTYIGPLARYYYFWKSNLTPAQKKERNEIFGTFKEGLRPVRPYIWKLRSGRDMLEIPVTTVPIIKTPFHMSYLLYLSGFSGFLMLVYLNLAIFMCKITGTSPSFLLHPTDLVGSDKLQALSFFPGMNLASERKATVFEKVIKTLLRHFNVVNMSTHAKHFLDTEKLKTIAAF